MGGRRRAGRYGTPSGRGGGKGVVPAETVRGRKPPLLVTKSDKDIDNVQESPEEIPESA